ncbi:MAG: transposase [Terriglobales bacterium]
MSDFRLSRGRDGPRQFLGQFEGILQTDGYAAYDQIGGPKMVQAALVIKTYTVPIGVTDVAVGDFNGDGKLNVAATNGGTNVSVLTGSGYASRTPFDVLLDTASTEETSIAPE